MKNKKTVQKAFIDNLSSIKQEQINQQEEQQTAANIGYQGTVTIQLRKGKKVVSSETYHNEGWTNLFKLIGLSFKEDDTYKQLLPAKIMLYKNATATYSERLKPTFDNKRSLFIAKDSNPTIVNTDPTYEDGKIKTFPSTSITYHFTVPTSYLSNAETDGGISKYIFNQICLYNSSEQSGDSLNNVIAYFYLTESSGGTTVWKPEKVLATETNYNLYIEWTMTIGNI